jgi:hypothetical protein
MVRVQDANRVDVAWIMENGDVILNGDLYTGPLNGPCSRTFRVSQRGDLAVNYVVHPSETYTVFQLDPEDSGSHRATLLLGGGDGAHGMGGDLRVADFTGTASIQLDGGSATARLGNQNHSATLVMSNTRNQEAVRVEANRGTLTIRDETNREVLRLESGNAVFLAGGIGKNGNVIVNNAAGQHMITLSGATGSKPLSPRLKLSRGLLPPTTH